MLDFTQVAARGKTRLKMRARDDNLDKERALVADPIANSGDLQQEDGAKAALDVKFAVKVSLM